MKTVTVGPNDAGQRLDKFLTKSFPNLPQSMMYKSIRKKDIKRNGRRCAISERLQEGDVLTLYLKDEFFQTEPEQFDFLKAPDRLNILYEDANILILDKQPGLLVHPDKTYHFDSLIARVQHYLYSRGEYRPEGENSFAPALVNRIDRNTGGLVMAAKNAEALRILDAKVRAREVKKWYLCVVCGTLEQKEDTLQAYLFKNEKQNRAFISARPQKGAKTIRTRYRVL
ncbi:MAG TPA: RluA family pseudouridine synthase, partial [Ruminococcaceae bacterium]|nr:RluA family pseudouridine synthase [Oscillospiraceae bacterium]